MEQQEVATVFLISRAEEIEQGDPAYLAELQGEGSAFLPAGDPAAPPPEVERPTVVLMGTDADGRADWLQAGRALARVLLVATVAGVAASPLTQALDWPATRSRMQSQLALVGHPQMLLRMGYPPETGAVASGRRPVAEVLRFA